MKNKWVVQHEFDNEPTFVVDKTWEDSFDVSKDASYDCITISHLAIKNPSKRKHFAELIACILNMWEI